MEHGLNEQVVMNTIQRRRGDMMIDQEIEDTMVVVNLVVSISLLFVLKSCKKKKTIRT